jgi:hypothetical protein
MNLLTLPLRLPFLPVEGVVRLAETIRDEAEREQHDPAAVRRELEAAQDARRAGEISAGEMSRAEAAAVRRVTSGPPDDRRDGG